MPVAAQFVTADGRGDLVDADSERIDGVAQKVDDLLGFKRLARRTWGNAQTDGVERIGNERICTHTQTDNYVMQVAQCAGTENNAYPTAQIRCAFRVTQRIVNRSGD